MMLTSVAAARSASDQSRDSRSARIAAPADSRLTADSGHSRDITQPDASVVIYVSIAFLLRGESYCVYDSAYVSAPKENGSWQTPAHQIQNCGSATPMTTPAMAPPKHGPMNGRPPRHESNACAAAHWRSNAGAPNGRSRIAKSMES